MDKKEYMKQYHEKHKERLNLHRKEEHFKNRNRELTRMKNYREKIRDIHPELAMFRRVKNRAYKNNITFTININDIIIPKKCPILGIPLRISNKGVSSDNSPSLDRIDNSKGYIKGNIQVISMKANAMKNNATKKELKLFADWIYNLHIYNKEEK